MIINCDKTNVIMLKIIIIGKYYDTRKTGYYYLIIKCGSLYIYKSNS